MEERKYIDVKLVVGVNEAKTLEFLNDGYEVLGMTSTVYGATQHYILMAKRTPIEIKSKPAQMTKTKKPSKIQFKDYAYEKEFIMRGLFMAWFRCKLCRTMSPGKACSHCKGHG